MPAEWEPHAATWLGWPHQEADWPGRYGPIPWAFMEVVRHLAETERVEILVPHPEVARQARRMMRESGVRRARVRLHVIPTNRGWTRDIMPTFVRRGKRLALVHWLFNGWAKYGDWRLDARVGEAIARITGLPRLVPTVKGARHPRRVVMEGGAFDVDGKGLVLVTEECLLSRVQARNPGLGRRGIEQVLRGMLGAEKVLWLEAGIRGDDTHGHVDDCARFVAPGVVVAAWEPRRGDANHAPLLANLRRLRRMTDVQGRRLTVETLPMPGPVRFRGMRLPASYANFYVANGRVLVPTFNDRRDREALTILAGVFPGREVIGIHALDLVWGLGTLHCMTQQQPLRRAPARRSA
jgi:agmatine deiminase